LAAALRWLKSDLQDRKPFVFEVLQLVRLPLISSKLLQQTIDNIEDPSLQIALRSLQKDLQLKRGSLVSLQVQPRKSAKKHIYIIGGSRKKLGSGWKQLSESTLDTVECFDTFKKQYTKVSSMEIERILPGVAALDGLIYVVGGEQESKILANGEVYCPQEDTWSRIEPMVIPRCAFGLTTWENYLYAFGGWVGEDIGGSIERYDPYLNEWTVIGDMLEPRFSMGVFTHQGLIYIVGGCTHTQRHLKDLCSYNPVTGEWAFLASMKVPRSQMGIAILGNELYVVGGSSKQAEVLRSVEKYSFDEDKWTELAPLQHGRANPAVGAADGRVYVFGGDQSHESNFFRAQVTLSSSEMYDPLTDAWEDCINLNESRSEAGVIVI
jgi:actin-binding protein IPP